MRIVMPKCEEGEYNQDDYIKSPWNNNPRQSEPSCSNPG